MSLTVVGSPPAARGLPDQMAPDQADPVVTITVQITLVGDELPPAASRLITDLEALVAQSSVATAVGSGQPGHLQFSSGPMSPGERPVEGTAVDDRRTGPLRLVNSRPRVRRIGRTDGAAPALHLCTGSRTLLHDGSPIHLTRREYDLLQFLCEHPRRVFSRAQLLQQVWGYDMVGTERTVDVHVRRLRVKLGECASVIATVRGVGYRLDDDTPVAIVIQQD